VGFVHVHLVLTDDGVLLVDTGLPGVVRSHELPAEVLQEMVDDLGTSWTVDLVPRRVDLVFQRVTGWFGDGWRVRRRRG
jgi:hypothetical protein